jgi:hypothetical protein
MIFCTLFNWAYLPQGLALYRSLERTTRGNFVLYVLSMDDFTLGALRKLGLANMRVIPLSEIEDDAMRAVRCSRSIGEYCWTCTTPLLLHVQKLHLAGTVVTYVDADLCFYSDPSVVLEEMGDGSILIHEHDFAPEHAALQDGAGRFNVGLASFRNDAEGRACLERWRMQCIDECVMDPAAGKCGDQNYLDEWPSLYSGLVISQNRGVGLAPWNVSKRHVTVGAQGLMADGQPVVFYHYHSLRLLRPRLGFKPLAMVSGNYFCEPEIVECIYAPYAAQLWRAYRHLKKNGYGIGHAIPTLTHVYTQYVNRQFLFLIAGRAISPKRNVQVLTALYGIDADREVL